MVDGCRSLIRALATLITSGDPDGEGVAWIDRLSREDIRNLAMELANALAPSARSLDAARAVLHDWAESRRTSDPDAYTKLRGAGRDMYPDVPAEQYVRALWGRLDAARAVLHEWAESQRWTSDPAIMQTLHREEIAARRRGSIPVDEAARSPTRPDGA